MVFTIFFSTEQIGLEHLEQIAKIGGTDKVYKESTFKGLDALFQNIAINPSYGLKILTHKWINK